MQQAQPVIAIKNRILRLFKFFSPATAPAEIEHNGVLRNDREFRVATKQLIRLGMPVHNDRPKNWDSLAALTLLSKYCPDKSSFFLDAGGEYYSCILPQLEIAGYEHLFCINLVFPKRRTRRGNISFEHGDITKTKYPDNYFNGITCLSVIEHGVDMYAYFKEMHRILKINGILFTSTDYWRDPIDTHDKIAYGQPIRIFTSEDILGFIRIAKYFGFELLGNLELDCSEKVVEWKEFNLHYTFIYFTLIKVR